MERGMRTLNLIILSCLFIFLGCKSNTKSLTSDVLPSDPDLSTAQGGEFYKNLCNFGPHPGNLSNGNSLWKFNPKEGCYLECNETTARKDFLEQLHNHRIYGNLQKVGAVDPYAKQVAQSFRDKMASKGRPVRTFENITDSMLFDGSKRDTFDLMVGDILLNFNFGQPNHAGIFYSKRGISHGRMVVEIGDPYITIFDGGWKKFSKLEEINAQTLWLRPKNITAEDREMIGKWAKLFESAKYDNLLIDDWAAYRQFLDLAYKSGLSRKSAAENAFQKNAQANQRPNSLNDTFSFFPQSGLYCSEGIAGIYSYFGFDQHGETPIDMIITFGGEGRLPDWEIYEDALSGFGATSDANVYMMHKLYFEYFKAFDSLVENKFITVPGYTADQNPSFAEAIVATFKDVEQNYQSSNLITDQLDEGIQKQQQLGLTTEPQQIIALKGLLSDAAQKFAAQFGAQMNTSQALYNLFYKNKAYGPHSFFENQKEFDFKGVFYNTNLNGNQALFIANWWNSVVGKPTQKGNIQTTLYRINNNLSTDQCQVAESAPTLKGK